MCCGFRIINMYSHGENFLNSSTTVLMKNSFVFSLVSDEYLAEAICKQSVENVWPGFSLLLIVQCERRDTLKELLSKKGIRT